LHAEYCRRPLGLKPQGIDLGLIPGPARRDAGCQYQDMRPRFLRRKLAKRGATAQHFIVWMSDDCRGDGCVHFGISSVQSYFV
jgi:hypothetical protein